MKSDYSRIKSVAMIKGIVMIVCLIAFRIIVVAQVHDVFTPLPENSIHLKGDLEKYIQNSIAHWNKGVVPYAGFVQIFRTGRHFMAQGEMEVLAHLKYLNNPIAVGAIYGRGRMFCSDWMVIMSMLIETLLY